MDIPTFKEQETKVRAAYVSGKLQPNKNKCCFWGIILDGLDNWFLVKSVWPERAIAHQLKIDFVTGGLYMRQDIIDTEENFLKVYKEGGYTDESLLQAVNSTLIMLKAIHLTHGEVIEDEEMVLS